MKDFLALVIQLIIELFKGFGLCYIAYLLLNVFLKNKSALLKFNEVSFKVIPFIGVVYLALLVISIGLSYFFGNAFEKYAVLYGLFGFNWKGFWLQVSLYTVATQLVRFKKIRSSKALMFMLSLILLSSIEMVVFLVTSFHVNFMPFQMAIWTFIGQMILITVLRMMVYIGLVSAFYFMNEQVKKFRFADTK